MLMYIMPLSSNCSEDLPCGQGRQCRQWEGLLLSAWRLYNYLCLIYCSTIIWADSHKSVQCSINLCNISPCNQMSYFWCSQLGLMLRPLAPAIPWAMWSQRLHREIVLAQKRANVFIWKAFATFFFPAFLKYLKLPSTTQAMPVICSLLPAPLTV